MLPTQTKVSRLGPGQPTGQASFQTNTSNRVTVQVTSNLENLLVGIEGPGGQTVNATTIAALGGEYLAFSGSDVPSSTLFLTSFPGFHYVYSFPSLGPGSYTVHFDASSGLAENVAVITQFVTDSKLGVALFPSDYFVVVGTPVVLAAAVYDGSVPVIGANVSATVVTENGQISTVSLADDGGAYDDRVGDGLYGSSFTPAAIGVHHVAATVDGLATNGEAFERDTGTQFTAVALTARLTGTVFDQALDPDSDGAIDGVAIDVQVEVEVAGRFGVWVQLESSTDKVVVRNTRTDLEPGIHTDAQAFLGGTTQNFGWLLKKEQEGQSGAVEFASRESGNPAELIVTVQ